MGQARERLVPNLCLNLAAHSFFSTFCDRVVCIFISRYRLGLHIHCFAWATIGGCYRKVEKEVKKL
jgi:hypothetical protein